MFSTYYNSIRVFTDNGKHKPLGNREDRCCRFCNLRKPQTTFKSDAHLLPQSMGNRSLLVFYECDRCNQLFGHTYEDHFAKYTKSHRAALGVNGAKNRIPAVRRKTESGVFEMRVSRESENQISAKLQGTITEADLDINERAIIQRIPMDAHIRWNIFRCLLHSGYLALHQSDLPNFMQVKEWLTNIDSYPGKLDFMKVYWSVGDASIRKFMPFIELYSAEKSTTSVYSKSIVVGFSSILVQFFVPSDQDLQLLAVGHRFDMPVYTWKHTKIQQRYGDLLFKEVDLSGTEILRDEYDEVKIPLPDDQWEKISSEFTKK